MNIKLKLAACLFAGFLLDGEASAKDKYVAPPAGIAGDSTPSIVTTITTIEWNISPATVPGTAFSAFFTLTLPSVVSGVVDIQLQSLGSVFGSKLDFSLYSYSAATKIFGAAPLPTASYGIKGVAGVSSLTEATYSNLLGGTVYGLKVTGLSNATGLVGASFTGKNVAAVAPVPELEAYAMLLAGLGLIGGIARRRENQKS